MFKNMLPKHIIYVYIQFSYCVYCVYCVYIKCL